MSDQETHADRRGTQRTRSGISRPIGSLLISVVSLVGAVGCAAHDERVSASVEKSVQLSPDPATVMVGQRTGEPVPGFGGAMRVEVGDISGGMTMLAVTYGPRVNARAEAAHATRRQLVEPRAVREGDVIRFASDGEAMTVRVVRLVNYAVGDDFAELEFETASSTEAEAEAGAEAGGEDAVDAVGSAIDPVGLPNFHRVNDDVFRGAQPTAEGYSTLREMGVATILNLRTFGADDDMAKAAGLDHINVTMQAWEAEDEEIVDALRVMTDPQRLSQGPIFVHCQQGADRTGVVVAMYRVVVEGWSREQAIEEMTAGGYGFNRVWTNLVAYMRTVDIDAIREAVER